MNCNKKSLNLLCWYMPAGTATPQFLDDYCEAFTEEGHNITKIDIIEACKNFERLPVDKWIPYLGSIMNQIKPDFIFSYDYWIFYPFISGNVIYTGPFSQPELNEKTISLFEILNIPTFALFGDDPYWKFGDVDSPNILFKKQLSSATHKSFLHHKPYVERMISDNFNNVYFMPIALNPKKFYQEELAFNNYLYDVTFAGSYTEKRGQILRTSVNKFNLTIFGDEGFFNDPVLKKYTHKKVQHGRELADIYRESKINLNIIGNNITTSVGMREFEIWGAGGFLISENCTGLQDVFENDKNFITFDSIDDLHEKIEYYLSHPEERIRLIKLNQQKIINEHTYNQRVKKIVEIL